MRPRKPTGKNLTYILRTCDQNMRAHGGFQWPKAGYVEAPDWKPTKECGNGLHGLLMGKGEGRLLSRDGIFMVCAADARTIVDLGEKVKFPHCWVEHCGDAKSAADYIIARGANPAECCFAFVTAGYGGTATAGYGGTATAGNYGTATAGYGGTATAGYGGTATAGNYGTATAGDYGTATAGHRGTATAGHGGTATAGNYGTATAGYGGTATAGDYGTATAGNYGTATAGNYGTATAGNYGTATAGNYGTATAGYGGTATAGYGGTATAGNYGTIAIKHWDVNRYRLIVGYPGEKGIKPNTPYRLNDKGKFIEVKA